MRNEEIRARTEVDLDTMDTMEAKRLNWLCSNDKSVPVEQTLVNTGVRGEEREKSGVPHQANEKSGVGVGLKPARAKVFRGSGGVR